MSVHVHRDLKPVRDGRGNRVAQVCPGCNVVLDGITGRPLATDTRAFARALELMHDYVDNAPRRRRRWFRR